MENKFDLIVIGAGPGGYVAALKAAKLGLKTAIVEKDRVGGTCLNRGCIPTKAMIHATSVYREIKAAAEYGIYAEGVSYDYEKILAYKQDVIDKLCTGVEHLFKTNSITHIKGKGRLEKDGSITVTDGEGAGSYEAKHTMICSNWIKCLTALP